MSSKDLPIEWQAHEHVYQEHFSIKINPFDQFKRFNGKGEKLSVYQAVLLDGIDREVRDYIAGREWAKTLRRTYKCLRHLDPKNHDDGTCLHTIKLIEPLVLDEIERILVEGEVYELLRKFKTTRERITDRINKMLYDLRDYRPHPQYAIMCNDSTFFRVIKSHEIDSHGRVLGFELSDNVDYHKGSIVAGSFQAYGDIAIIAMAILEIERNPIFNLDTDRYKLYSSDGTIYPIDWPKARQTIHLLSSGGGEFILPLKQNTSHERQ